MLHARLRFHNEWVTGRRVENTHGPSWRAEEWQDGLQNIEGSQRLQEEKGPTELLRRVIIQE